LDVPLASVLIKETDDGFGLTLKSGKHLPIPPAVFNHHGRSLMIQLSYNRSFSGDLASTASGSWTRRMRPDFTLSIWPSTLTPEQAEAQELMVHVHFDAKYRVNQLSDVFGSDSNSEEDQEKELNQEKIAQKYGNSAKRSDLLKMHAYKDAIRRTEGAYVLYPGNGPRQWRQRFHEILPGLGAFTMRPGAENVGINDLREFLIQIADQLCDRASRRERLTYHLHRIYNDESVDRVYTNLEDPLLRDVPIGESMVLLGWYHDDEHLEWIQETGKYLFRIDATTDVGAVGARHVLLYSHANSAVSGLFAVKSATTLITGSQAAALAYPRVGGTDYIYAVFDLAFDSRFDGYTWDLSSIDTPTTSLATLTARASNSSF
jgi:hypothetical protein